MFINHLKIAYRNIIRDKYYSLISFLGLTIGLSFFSLMLLVINHEFSYDSSYSDADRIYRTVLSTDQAEIQSSTAQLPLPFTEVLGGEIDGIEVMTKVYGMPQQILETSTSRGRLDNMVATDAFFFDVFDLDLLAGDSKTALENQMSAVLTKETAQRFFGNQNPIGKTIEIERYGLFTVTGVLDDLPKNSSFQFNALFNVSVDQYLENFGGPDWFRDYYTSWRGRVAHNYVKLENSTNPEYVAEQFGLLTMNYFGASNAEISFSLQPIKDLHFHSSNIQSNISAVNGLPGNIQYVYIFAIIAILILSIACINYMNLSSARSIKRTAEVGLRSVFGANRFQIIMQFLLQSILMTSLSIIPAVSLLQLMIPYFQSITGIALTLELSDMIWVGIFALPSILLIGAISGLYPAIMLSRNQLSQTVKQKSSSGVQSSYFRKGLVIGQFALTYCIIMITFVAGRQMNFIFDKELGFDQEEVVVVEINDGRLRNYISEIKQAFDNQPNIVGMAGMTRMISGYREPDLIQVNRMDSPEESLPFSFYGFDEDVIPIMNLDLVQGRNFIAEGGVSLNPNTVLINESAASILFPNESAIGKNIVLSDDEHYEMTIIGVVKDFHYRSLHNPIDPLVIGYINNPFVGIDDFAIRITGTQIPETIAIIERTISNFIELDEEIGLEYEFLNTMINDYYKTDANYRLLFKIGALLTIVLSVIGLLGLTAFYSEIRTKEFGIRKVLGATLNDLISLQSVFFLRLISISILIGVPISIFGSQSWLTSFTYRAPVGVELFVLAASCTVLIAMIPILFFALKTSLKNPISQLRSE